MGVVMDPGGDDVLHIARLDGETLVAEGLGLARAFFTGDPSALGPTSYDALAGKGDVDRITTGDIQALNRTMRARSSHAWWAELVDQELPWLEAIPKDLDLIEGDDDSWDEAGGATLGRSALDAVIGPHRGAAVATKMLHLKRPRLFPVLDDLVAQMLGLNAHGEPTRERRVELATELMLHLRQQGRANIEPLRAVQGALRDERIERSLVRILDAVLWFSHPAAGVPGVHRVIQVGADGPA